MGHKYPKDLVFELLALWRLGNPGLESGDAGTDYFQSMSYFSGYLAA